jgi:hypothetical protein
MNHPKKEQIALQGEELVLPVRALHSILLQESGSVGEKYS